MSGEVYAGHHCRPAVMVDGMNVQEKKCKLRWDGLPDKRAGEFLLPAFSPERVFVRTKTLNSTSNSIEKISVRNFPVLFWHGWKNGDGWVCGIDSLMRRQPGSAALFKSPLGMIKLNTGMTWPKKAVRHAERGISASPALPCHVLPDVNCSGSMGRDAAAENCCSLTDFQPALMAGTWHDASFMNKFPERTLWIKKISMRLCSRKREFGDEVTSSRRCRFG